VHRMRLVSLALVLSALAVSSAWAQAIRLKPPKVELPKFDLSGTLEHIENGRLDLKTDAGYTWTLLAKRDLKVELTGKSKPTVLAPGQYVEFLAKIDMQKGKTTDEVVRMTIFTPDKRRMPGIMPDLGFGDQERTTLRKKKDQSQSPSDGGDAPAKSDEPTGDTPAKGKAAAGKDYAPGGDNQPKTTKANSKIESFAVHGRVMSVGKNREITVQVPINPFTKNSLIIAVSEDADIDIELNDISALLLARPGDHVQARGDQTGDGVGVANHLTIRLSDVLGAAPPDKKPPRKTGSASEKSGSSSKKPAK
jgi:hypothetical protein